MQTSQLQQIVTFGIEIVSRVKPVVDRCDRALADQLRRAMNSVVLNTAEATGSDPGNRRARLATARGSVHEARAAIKLAAAWGYIPTTHADAIDRDLDRLGARLYGLSRALSPPSAKAHHGAPRVEVPPRPLAPEHGVGPRIDDSIGSALLVSSGSPSTNDGPRVAR